MRVWRKWMMMEFEADTEAVGEVELVWGRHGLGDTYDVVEAEEDAVCDAVADTDDVVERVADTEEVAERDAVGLVVAVVETDADAETERVADTEEVADEDGVELVDSVAETEDVGDTGCR